jgi:hypothetical protein
VYLQKTAMPNSKISELKEAFALRSENILDSFPTQAQISGHGNGDNNASLIIARANSHNEKISYNHLKSSLLDKSVLLTGNQLISGQKTFKDPCTFLSRTNINEIFDETQTGDISGNIFVGTSGLFQKIGISNIFHERGDEPSYTLHVSGGSCFLGDITNTGYHRHIGNIYRIGHSNLLGGFNTTGDSWRIGDVRMKGEYHLTGDFTQTGDSNRYGDQFVVGSVTHSGHHTQKGDLYRIGESNFLGGFSITGDSLMVGDVKMEGDYYLTGDFTQTGNSTIFGDERVTGDVHVGEYIYHYQDEDTFIKLDENQISLTAGGDSEILISESNNDFISFSTSGEEQMRIDNSGFVGINTVDTLGELSVTGSSYLEKAYTTGEDGRWERIFGGSDEVVSFVASLNKGSDNFYLDFPKTFGEKPALTLSLENSQGGPIVPYMISDLNEFRFAVNFGSELQNDNYKLHINARPTGQSSANKTTTQSFATDIPEGVNSFEVQYPCSFHAIPSVSTVIESEGVMIPYLVSGVSRDSYHIIFSSLSKSDSRIHTHAVR